MEKTKSIFLFIISIILSVLLLCTITYAHSGGTDSNGSHYDNSTGEYHYHHSYPAHQHTNGICPYDFDDKTGQNSGDKSNKHSNSSDITFDNKLVKSVTAIAVVLFFITVIYIFVRGKEFYDSFKEWLQALLFLIIFPYGTIFFILLGSTEKVNTSLLLSLCIYDIPIIVIFIKFVVNKIKSMFANKIKS